MHGTDLPPPAGAAAPRPAGTWALLKEALAGTERDLTTESTGRAILLLAVPMVLEMVMESVFAIADIFWVSRLGKAAVASVGLTETLLTLVYAGAMGLSMGATAVVSRRIGEKDPEGAARAAVQALIIGLALSVGIGGLGAVYAPDLLRLVGASPEVVETGAGFARIMLGGSVTIVMLFLVNAIFRGAGDAAIAMRTLWLANGINIVLAPFLVFGWGPFPQLGVEGAAVATTIGRGVGVLYQLRALLHHESRIHVRRAHLRIDREAMATLLRVSRSGVLQVVVGMASWIFLVRILTAFGDAAVAGYTIALRIILFALLPSAGLGNAAATLVGQNLGARQPERAEGAVWRAATYNAVFLGLLGVAIFAGAGTIIGWFGDDPDVAAHGVRCLRIVSAGFLFYAFGMVMVQAFNGAGDTRTPTLVNLFCFWAWELPVAYVLAHPLGFGADGVFWAILSAFSAEAVLGVVLFRRGRWKAVQV